MPVKVERSKSIWRPGVPAVAKTPGQRRVLLVVVGVLLVVLAFTVYDGRRRIAAEKLMSQASHVHMGGHTREAKKLYERVLDLNPNHADANFNLGMIEVARNPKKAVALYKKAVAADPTKADYPAWLAYAYHNQLKDYDQAIVWMKKAIALDPENYQYHLAVSGFTVKAGKTDEAIGHLKQVLKLAPKLLVPHRRLAKLYRQKGMINEARRHEAVAGKLAK